MSAAPYVAVCGPAEATDEEMRRAEEVGRLLAEAGAIVLCGGLSGVMDSAARGATAAGGIAIGLLPGEDRHLASPHLTIALPIGMGEARNALIARAADVLIAVGGGYGTLSEIALARKMGRPVVGISTWELGSEDAVVAVSSPDEAVREALRLSVG